MRLFTAISFPSEVLSNLKLLGLALPGNKTFRWEQAHLTLNFLGEISEEGIETIKKALTQFESAPFSLQLQGLGTFPQQGIPRVLWTGVAPCPPLLSLQEKLKKQCLSLGIPQEQRSYRPHVTLIRFRHPPSPQVLKDFLRKYASFETPIFPITYFSLFSSKLDPEGSYYREEFRRELKLGSN